MKHSDLIFNQSDIPRRTAKIISTGEPLGSVADMAECAGMQQLRIQHEILLPGHRSSSPHAHTKREEFIYVVKGEPDVWLDGELYRLKPGDCVALCAGTGIAHSLINNTTSEVLVLAVASVPIDDGCFYPLTGRRDNVPDDMADAWTKRPRGPHDGMPQMVNSPATPVK
jgi:uncharacterized cupin superfamily protein